MSVRTRGGASAKLPHPMAESDDERVRVVLIDDHELVAEALQVALGSRGVDVVARAGSLAEGAAAVTAERPDVVLLDFRLPDGDGLDGLRVVDGALPGVAVLVVTAVADDRTAVDVLAAGATGYLTKDVPIAELVDAVRMAARGEPVIPLNLHGAVMARLRSRGGDADGRPLVSLTAKEQETLELLGRGLGIAEVADALFVSRNTARKHVQSVLVKLGAHTQLEAVAIARRTGLLRA